MRASIIPYIRLTGGVMPLLGSTRVLSRNRMIGPAPISMRPHPLPEKLADLVTAAEEETANAYTLPRPVERAVPPPRYWPRPRP